MIASLTTSAVRVAVVVTLAWLYLVAAGLLLSVPLAVALVYGRQDGHHITLVGWAFLALFEVCIIALVVSVTVSLLRRR